jgi:hypothetical protein
LTIVTANEAFKYQALEAKQLVKKSSALREYPCNLGKHGNVGVAQQSENAFVRKCITKPSEREVGR